MGLIMLEPIEQLASKLGIPVRAEGALRLVRLQDFERIVEACKSSGLLILGIEAFRLAAGKIVPDTDFIADFSELASKPWNDACLEAARAAVPYLNKAKGRTDLWFDFALRERR